LASAHLPYGLNLPQSKKANFDASHELEELLLEDNPLKAKQRKANQDNLTPEMRQMEEQSVVSRPCSFHLVLSHRPDSPHTTLRDQNELPTIPTINTSSQQ
jgi:hypothetical protein